MSLLVADSRSENFDKPPPPKKKWIQNYLVDRDSEPDSDGGSSSPNPDVVDQPAPTAAEAAVLTAAAAVAASGKSDKEVVAASGAIVQSVINQFQDYIHQQTNRNLHHQTAQNAAAIASRTISYHEPLVAAADVNHQQFLLRPISAGQLAVQLLDPLTRGGDKFNDSLQKISTKSSLVPISGSKHSLSSTIAAAASSSSSRLAANDSASSDVNCMAAPSDTLGLSKKDIGGVVQGVISQFLTGSLADVQFCSRSGSSSSRKRCRRGHEKCPSRSHRSSRGSDSSGHHHSHHRSSRIGYRHGQSGHHNDREGVLVDNTNCQNVPEDYSGPQAKYHKSHEEFVTDAGGVLNLSLPKTGSRTAQDDFNFSLNSRVTFAAEDSCYSFENSKRSMEISKSQQMYNADEALDLDIKSTAAPTTTSIISISAVEAVASHSTPAALLRRQSQNSYHSAFYPPEAGFRPQSSHSSLHSIAAATTGYIKPVPLSTLIKAQASLSPQGSPSPSPPSFAALQQPPVSISAPVNLIVKPTAVHVSEPTAVIQTPQHCGSSRYNQKIAVEKYSTRFLSTPGAVKQYSTTPPPDLIPTKRTSPVTTLSQPKAIKIASADSKPLTAAKIAGSPPSSSNRRGNNIADKAADKTAEKSDKSADNSSIISGVKAVTSTRELHNQLEKNRRAQLKLCFEELASECQIDPKTKASNLTVIRSAYKVIMGLRRDERENEKEIANLAEEKIKLTQRLEELRRKLPDFKLAED